MRYKHIKTLAVTAAVALAACTSANAQLVLHLDTATKQLWFTGTAIGTPGSLGLGFYAVEWADGTLTGSPTSVSWLSDAVIGVTGNTYNYGLGVSGSVGSVRAYGDGGVMVELDLTSNSQTTFTGAGLAHAVSYATGSWNPTTQQILESYIGSTLPLTLGTDFGPISVVPEPHEYAAMAALGLLGFAGFRRWHQRA
jgi:hypothetical protein